MPEGASQDTLNAFNAGVMSMNAGRASEAVEKFKTVTTALPNFAPAHSALGAALGKIGKNDEAISELKKALELDPNDQQALVNIGQLCQLSGRNSEALDYYQKYLSLYPKGQYVPQISMMVKTMQMELMRRKGAIASSGQDNYLSEALAPGAAKWEQSSVTVFIADGKAKKGYKEQFADILKSAFAAWSEATKSKLKFQFVDKPSAALIRCSWTDNVKDLLNPVEGGQAIAVNNTHGKIIKAEIMLLTSNPNVPVFSDKYFKHVCLHEVGHALGLGGHSSQSGDVMFPYANYESASGEMSERDKKTIGMLYK